MSRIEIANYDHENFRLTYPRFQSVKHHYGRMLDVGSKKSTRGIRLKDARSLISEIDGHSRQKTQEFISSSVYAMEKVNFVEKSALLEKI